jgi:Na+-driven multidrug efflux pump
VLIGAGDARYIAAVQPITVLVFLPLAALVLHFDLGLTGLWWALAGWMVARLTVMVVRERGDAWVITGATR